MQNTVRRAQNPKRIFLDLIFSIIIPSFILTRGENYLPVDPVTLFFIALAFPTGYGLYDLIAKKYVNIISILGFVNTLLSGVVVIFEASKFFIVFKEAGFPLLIGLALLYYNKSVADFIKVVTDDMLNKTLILTKITSKTLQNWYRKVAFQFTFPFFLSALLNLIITYIIIQSPTGTQAFNEEMGRLIVWGFLGIAIPTTIATIIILILGFRTLQKLTGLSFEQLMLSEEEMKKNQQKIKELD
ncbi:MAG: hypothetical protein LAT82_02735 [Nanoarchaeota archaeon]|nr:hypothetical protein [Nanoarchaeota archaeon]